jgi:hypothetical protein
VWREEKWWVTAQQEVHKADTVAEVLEDMSVLERERVIGYGGGMAENVRRKGWLKDVLNKALAAGN